MNRAYVEQAKREIQRWESEGPGFLSSVTDIMLHPAQRVARALIPRRVRRAVSKATYELIVELGSATEFFIDRKRIYERVDAAYRKRGDELRAADSAAKHYWNKGIVYGAAEGGATGAVGFVGLAADIPALLGISIRSIRQIGACYGYDVDSHGEKEHTLHVLRLGSASTFRAKMEFLAGIKEVQRVLFGLGVTSATERLVSSQLSRLSVLSALHEFAERLGVQLTTRKALEMVPIAGAVIGGSFNAMFVNDVGRAAYMAYRHRRIVELESPEMAALALA